MKFTKESFKKKYKTGAKTPKETEELEEVVIGGGGDKVVTNGEVTTKTQGTDVPQEPKTMDKHIGQVRNPSATFGYGGEMGIAYGGRQGNVHVNGSGMNLDVNDEELEELDESAKDKMKKLVKELLNSRDKSRDFVNNQEPSLEALNDVVLEGKVDDLLTTLLTKTPDELNLVLNYLKFKYDNKGKNNV